MLYVDASAPTIATPSNRPTPETAPPAPAASPTWRDLLAAVPGDAAFWAVKAFGGTLTRRGTCGEDGDAWTYTRGPGHWFVDNGYVRTRCLAEDVPQDVEVLEWADSHKAAALSAALDRRVEAEYVTLGELADSLGEAGEFHAAVKTLHTDDPYALGESLYERLTTGAGPDVVEYEDDEDRLSGR